MLRSFLYIFFVMVAVSSFSPFSLAKEVQQVYPDGSIELEDGDRVQLAGIKLAPESIKLIPMLVSGQSIRMDKAKEFSSEDSSIPQPVYLYLKVKEIGFSLKSYTKPNQSKVMINELLLEMGAAWVIQDIPFSKQKNFLEIQERAKATGQGVWSYSEEERASLDNFPLLTS